jgi:hypothetical protein
MTDRLMQFFSYQGASPRLLETNKRFHERAAWIDETLPVNAERSVALRRLLDSRDASVRAVTYTEPG